MGLKLLLTSKIKQMCCCDFLVRFIGGLGIMGRPLHESDGMRISNFYREKDVELEEKSTSKLNFEVESGKVGSGN